jgi:hypothetical protein
LNNIEQKGEYRWVDGTVPGTLPWDRRQPNKDENGCANINEYGKVNDENCDNKRGYICEKIVLEQFHLPTCIHLSAQYYSILSIS